MLLKYLAVSHITLSADDDEDTCRCAPLGADRHVLLMFRDSDVTLDGSTVIELDEGVSVVPLEASPDIASVIPTTLLSRSEEGCA